MSNWKQELKAKHKAEMAAGRRRVMVNMAEGLIEKLAYELGIPQPDVTLVTNGDDARTWEVRVQVGGENPHMLVENFWDFPSDELKATILLMRG